MKNTSFKEFFQKSKTVYTLAAVSFCLAVIAAGVIYSRTMSTTKNSLPQTSTTEAVHKNQTNATDPRTTGSTTEKKATSTTAEAEDEITLPEKTTSYSAVHTTSYDITTAEYTTSAAVSVAASQSFIRPHDGEIIKDYSPDVPVYCETMNDWRTHNGIDIAVNEGDEAVSVGNGKVSKVLVDSSYGYTVEVDYGTFTARYCGMKQGESATIGQMLEKGDSVGVVDTVPCEAEASPHFHFEVIVDGQTENPETVCKWQ